MALIITSCAIQVISSESMYCVIIGRWGLATVLQTETANYDSTYRTTH